MKTAKKLLGLSVLSAILLSCSAAPTQTGASAPAQIPMSPIPARVLLLVPYEFESFTYTSQSDGREVWYPLGEMATSELRHRLVTAFSWLTMEPVSSESRALSMLNPGDPRYAEVRRYDYLAVPRFMDVSGWTKPLQYGFDVDVVLELYRTDGSKVTKIRGHGETNTGSLSGLTPAQSARLALTNAVEAIRESLAEKRHLFASKR